MFVLARIAPIKYMSRGCIWFLESIPNNKGHKGSMVWFLPTFLNSFTLPKK
jgi:hypothetical protein